jgi:hypothetical protein
MKAESFWGAPHIFLSAFSFYMVVEVIVFSFGHIAFVEFVFASDFYDFEAFGYHKGRKLPEFFKQSV